MIKQIVFIVFILHFTILVAQPPKKFFCRYGGNGYDVGYDLKQTSDKGYVICGSTNSFGQGNTDFYLLKLDSLGQKIFEKAFGGYNNEIAKSIVQLPDSSYILSGYTSSFGFGGYDIFIVKVDKTGNLQWQKTIGGEDWDFSNSIVNTSDGGYIICGTTYSFGYGNADGYVIKIDALGNTIWSKAFGGSKDDEFKSVIQTNDGKYVLTGYTKSYNDSLGDIWVFKLDVNGDSIWSKYYGGNKEDFGNQIVENNASDLFIAGATESFGVGLLDAYALKLNSVGLLTNTFINGTAANNEIYTSASICYRVSNNVISFIEYETAPGFELQTKIIEFDFWFGYQQATDFGSTIIDETFKVITTKDKGYAVTGFTEGYNAILTDVYFIKLDSNLAGDNNSIVSIDEIEKNDLFFKIYPNPTMNKIQISSNINISIDDLRLFDAIGNEILISNNQIYYENKSSISISLETLKTGMYYLKIRNQTRKISVIHP